MRARNVDGGLSEVAFQAQVAGLAAFYGWRLYHPPDNRPTTTRGGRAARQRVEPGFPDLTMIRGPELIVAELKAERGRLGPGQQEWLEAFGVLAAAVARAVAETEGAQAAGYLAVEDLPVVDVYLWRPSDWPAIEARLARGRPLAPKAL